MHIPTNQPVLCVTLIAYSVMVTAANNAKLIIIMMLVRILVAFFIINALLPVPPIFLMLLVLLAASAHKTAGFAILQLAYSAILGGMAMVMSV